tara:strand:+ start:1164 stop:1439 length:276 start_codon:yes stop_codon:yes gene_type:complete
MAKEKNKRFELSKEQMLSMLRILQWHTDLVMDIQLQHFEANKKTMKLEQSLHHEKWKVRYLLKRLKQTNPDEAVTEEELEAQIYGADKTRH